MIKAVIFDMDGVISDTQKLHGAVESEFLARFGVNLTINELEKKYAGVSTKKFFTELLEGKATTEQIEELLEEKSKLMVPRAKEKVDDVPGSIKLIKQLKENNYPLAVASASVIEYVNAVLETLNIKQFFDAVLSTDMVKKGKPAPDVFLKAAELLKVKPENCLVIEDGRSGMIGAKAAGMKCIGLVKDRNETDYYPATVLVESLKEVDVKFIENLN